MVQFFAMRWPGTTRRRRRPAEPQFCRLVRRKMVGGWREVAYVRNPYISLPSGWGKVSREGERRAPYLQNCSHFARTHTALHRGATIFSSGYGRYRNPLEISEIASGVSITPTRHSHEWPRSISYRACLLGIPLFRYFISKNWWVMNNVMFHDNLSTLPPKLMSIC